MAGNPFQVGGSNAWNYSDDSKDNYSEQLAGTVVEIKYTQALDFTTRQPQFWPDGNPKTNFRFIILDGNGNEFAWTISTSRNSAAIQAIGTALNGNPNQGVDVSQLLGKIVVITTKPGSYNSQKPRPWWVQVQGDGDPSVVRGLVNELEERKAQIQQAKANQAAINQQGVAVAMQAMQPAAPAPQQAHPSSVPQAVQYPQAAAQVPAGVPAPPDVYSEEEIPF